MIARIAFFIMSVIIFVLIMILLTPPPVVALFAGVLVGSLAVLPALKYWVNHHA